MKIDARVQSRLEQINKILEDIARLEGLKPTPKIHWDLTTVRIKLENVVIYLRDSQLLLDTSNVLDLADKQIAGLAGEVEDLARQLL